MTMPTIYRAISYMGPMPIDADGAPNAYHPEDIGLDYLANAGSDGDWWGVATDPEGRPFVQGPDDPCPGYYVSTTALVNGIYATSDPRRYVDSLRVPFIVVPFEAFSVYGIRTGSIAKVSYRDRMVLAVVADIGPRGKWGKGSIRLAELLSIPSDPKRGGLEKPEVCYTVYGVGFPAHEIEIGMMDDVSVLQHWASFRWPQLRERMEAIAK